MKILIKKELYYSKEKYDRVTGLTDFVNLLFENYFYQQEIPKAERLAKENESEEEKKIEQILEKAGQELLFINGISPGEQDGQIVYEWHVTTSTGEHYVIFQDDKVLLFDGESHQVICEMPI